VVLDNLGNSLRSTLKKIANAPYVDKTLIKEVVRDVQRALLQADINVQMVLKLTKELEHRALTEKPKSGMSSKEHVIHILYEELVKILGETKEVPLKKHIIMMVGLYGQGKTTTAGKLAKYYQRKGLRPALIAADVHRPAAYDQLSQIAEQVNVPIYGQPKKKKAVPIVKEGLKKFKGHDIIIIDTSGRHSLEANLIKEMENISKACKADEKFLVMDAAVGQQAGPQAEAFHDAVDITGVIITKLDGTAKGGGALSAVSVTKAPIVFIGVGEHLEDLETFDPPRFISRLLGMGDLQTLLEKAQEVVGEEEMKDSASKMMTGKFTLLDMQEQLEMMGKMGALDKMIDLIPGFGVGKKNLKDIPGMDIHATEERLEKFKIIMKSMNQQELEDPKLLKSSRVKRIARGSGCDQKEVRALLKQYNQFKKMMKGLMGNRKMKKQLMKQLKVQDM
jgi:signal recognition particle subunit SRP54